MRNQKHIVFPVLLLALVSLTTTGCTRAFRNVLGVQSAAKGTPELERFRPSHAGFEVNMPGPRDEIRTDNIMTRKYIYTHEDGTYSIIYGFVHGTLMSPLQFQTALDELCDKFVGSVNGKPTSTKAIEYYGSGLDPKDNRIGKEIEGTTSDGKQFFKMRVYLIGNVASKTSYTLIVVGEKPFVDSSEASRFLSSLKLLDRH